MFCKKNNCTLSIDNCIRLQRSWDDPLARNKLASCRECRQGASAILGYESDADYNDILADQVRIEKERSGAKC